MEATSWIDIFKIENVGHKKSKTGEIRRKDNECGKERTFMQ